MTIVLPLPPIANRHRRPVVVRGHARLTTSTEARAYAQAVALQAAVEQWPKLTRPLALTITVYEARRGTDADARIKSLFDALTGALYDDDGQIVRYAVRRDLDHRLPRVVVEVLTVLGVTESCGCAKCAKARRLET